MKLYHCSRCHNQLYFENSICLHCSSPLGFDPASIHLITLGTKNVNAFFDLLHPDRVYHYCQNAISGTCNWLVPELSSSVFCSACALNRTIPELSTNENLARWKRIEMAKHRLVYSLLRLRLPFLSKDVDPDSGLAFDFLDNITPGKQVITGHEHGTITLNIEEADEVKRVKHKLDLGERYRTLLGHFRHEIGHYYWERLIEGGPDLDQFRKLFGDERTDYGQSIRSYYENGPMPNWEQDYISPYATSHPWEDWAETWSHYFHLMDALETAYAFGIAIQPSDPEEKKEPRIQLSQDPYCIAPFPEIFRLWLPLTFAINSLNRSLGYDDFYPFLISPHIMVKLEFIHQVCNPGGRRTNPPL
jgi:hypothetical protein